MVALGILTSSEMCVYVCVCEKAPTCQREIMDLCASFEITKLFICSYDDSPSWGTQ